LSCTCCPELLLDSELELLFSKESLREKKKEYFGKVLGGKTAVCKCGNVQAFEPGRVERMGQESL